MVNIKPFGKCRSLAYPPTAAATSAHHGHLTPMPCVPGTTSNWSAVDANSILVGKPALLDTAKLRCIYGGQITIVNPGQSLETTGAEKVTVVNRDIVINDYFWTDENGEECDTASTNAISSPTLCLQTSLSEGSQLVVNLGRRSYTTIVGKKGVVRVENVDVTEISLDLPSSRKKKPTTGKSKQEPVSKTLPSKKDPITKTTPPKKDPVTKTAPPKKEKPATAKPVETTEVNTTTVPAASDNGWGDPVANPKIRRNSPRHLYGKVRRDANGNPRNHQGFDYYAPVGTPIISVGDGVVHAVQSGHSSYGLNVTIRHNRGKGYVYSFYAHLNNIPNGIKTGKVVRKGEVIGYAGTTGNAKGFTGEDQHLHFECRTSPGHQLGLGGKENPNSIVATKFSASNIHGTKK